MLQPRLRSRLFIAIAFAPILMASKCRKDKDKEEVVDIEPAGPQVTLRVTGVEPDRVDAGELTRAVVYGAGFEQGIQVRVDESPVASVTVQDSGVLNITLPPLSAGQHDLRVRNPNGETATLRNAVVALERLPADPTAGLNCDDITINFAFDSSAVETPAAAILGKHMACFSSRTGEVRIEAHCDERGTTDYNLALGQRRADAVKRYLQGQGVTAGRIRAVSYGEEQPLDRSHDEAAWAANRRAKISVSR